MGNLVTLHFVTEDGVSLVVVKGVCSCYAPLAYPALRALAKAQWIAGGRRCERRIECRTFWVVDQTCSRTEPRMLHLERTEEDIARLILKSSVLESVLAEVHII